MIDKLIWEKLDDVPRLVIEWVEQISNEKINNLTEIIELVSSFEDWSDNIQHKQPNNIFRKGR
jgi:hypothetical protein